MIEEQMPAVGIDNHQLIGWVELDSWAYLNHPTWREAEACANRNGLNLLEQARLLCAFLLSENLAMKESMIKLANETKPVYVIPPPPA